jgi:chromosome partitioning protein
LKKVAVFNIKGGVGKTTTSLNLACLLAKKGLSVLLWDLDPQGGCSFFFDKENKNDNTHCRLFDKYLSIYEVITPSESYQIDLIANDSLFSDQFLNKASRMATLNYVNKVMLTDILSEVEDDYDVCIFDCSPGKFLLHDNIFHCADLILMPNIPSPLSIYCNNQFFEGVGKKIWKQKKVLSFFNMVQLSKTLHKYYLNTPSEVLGDQLASYIPFYAEIEALNYKKESIFHQLKTFKTISYYEKVWEEICSEMNWAHLNPAANVVSIQNDLEELVLETVEVEPELRFNVSQ